MTHANGYVTRFACVRATLGQRFFPTPHYLLLHPQHGIWLNNRDRTSECFASAYTNEFQASHTHLELQNAVQDELTKRGYSADAGASNFAL